MRLCLLLFMMAAGALALGNSQDTVVDIDVTMNIDMSNSDSKNPLQNKNKICKISGKCESNEECCSSQCAWYRNSHGGMCVPQKLCAKRGKDCETDEDCCKSTNPNWVAFCAVKCNERIARPLQDCIKEEDRCETDTDCCNNDPDKPIKCMSSGWGAAAFVKTCSRADVSINNHTVPQDCVKPGDRCKEDKDCCNSTKPDKTFKCKQNFIFGKRCSVDVSTHEEKCLVEGVRCGQQEHNCCPGLICRKELNCPRCYRKCQTPRTPPQDCVRPDGWCKTDAECCNNNPENTFKCEFSAYHRSLVCQADVKDSCVHRWGRCTTDADCCYYNDPDEPVKCKPSRDITDLDNPAMELRCRLDEPKVEWTEWWD